MVLEQQQAPLVHFRVTGDPRIKELQVNAGSLGSWKHYVKVSLEDLVATKAPKLAYDLALVHGAPTAIIDCLFAENHKPVKALASSRPFGRRAS